MNSRERIQAALAHREPDMVPIDFNGHKAADEVRVKRRHLLMAMGAAMVLGLLVSYYRW